MPVQAGRLSRRGRARPRPPSGRPRSRGRRHPHLPSGRSLAGRPLRLRSGPRASARSRSAPFLMITHLHPHPTGPGQARDHGDRVRRALVRDTAQRCYRRARIAVKTREFERATTLLGAAAAIVEQQATAWPPDETPHLERSRAAVADALDRQPLERGGPRARRCHRRRRSRTPSASTRLVPGPNWLLSCGFLKDRT